jgi:FSR family fosmidomycin resistance protein-like MFS transporter
MNMNDDYEDQTTTEPKASPSSKLIIATVILAHAMVHFQSGVLPVLYPTMIMEFGIDYVQLGVLQFLSSFATGFPQMFVTNLRRFVSRKILLGVGTLFSSLLNIAASFTSSFQNFLALRVVSRLGISPQHPVGASLITSYSQSSWRGRVFGLNLSLPMVGSTIAPIVGAALLLAVGWRSTLLIITLPVLISGFVILLSVKEEREEDAKTKRRGFLNTLRSKNVLPISLLRSVMAFRMGVRSFLPIYFINFLGLSTELSSGLYSLMLFGGVLGPFFWGYLSDRTKKKPLIIGVLAVSGLLYLTLSFVENALFLAPILFFIGFMAQTVIMQSVLSESVEKTQLDQVFGLFYTLGFTLGSFSSVIFGYVVETYGFQIAFSYITAVTSVSLIPAFLIKDEKLAS